MSYPQPQQQTWQTGEPPLWAPYYGAPFPAAVKRFWKKYTVFSGRASRSEYWWWVLVSAAVGIVLQIIATVAGGAGATTTASGTVPGPAALPVVILLIAWGLATFIPSLALTVRRLHDGNFSGWLVLLALVPFLGGLALLVMTILPSNPAGQRFDQPGGA
ncbi:DUF805 domain-containing protein [Arthrobacter sp. 24S4-2]|uniref:DUF805 domain-containing protein n=1 Tax=Arthrobacter sp. 24S4-2 TaxID=2575374 RepID=UPI0010C7A863|nr:DUF805 domain-containing protein [Arthrobacter sp. 24S4-2]QCO98625.1 DUF805 domain-containing protein [Arthrobacter sp. 24S4-2]